MSTSILIGVFVSIFLISLLVCFTLMVINTKPENELDREKPLEIKNKEQIRDLKDTKIENIKKNLPENSEEHELLIQDFFANQSINIKALAEKKHLDYNGILNDEKIVAQALQMDPKDRESLHKSQAREKAIKDFFKNFFTLKNKGEKRLCIVLGIVLCLVTYFCFRNYLDNLEIIMKANEYRHYDKKILLKYTTAKELHNKWKDIYIYISIFSVFIPFIIAKTVNWIKDGFKEEKPNQENKQ